MLAAESRQVPEEIVELAVMDVPLSVELLAIDVPLSVELLALVVILVQFIFALAAIAWLCLTAGHGTGTEIRWSFQV